MKKTSGTKPRRSTKKSARQPDPATSPEGGVAVAKEPRSRTTAKRNQSSGSETRGQARQHTTEVLVKADIGLGNTLFIRGESNASLSWDQGVALENIGPDEWSWKSSTLIGPTEFKLLINDQTWSQNDNFTVGPGQKIICHPVF